MSGATVIISPAGYSVGGSASWSSINVLALATSASPNTSAYSALNVPGMSAGTNFADPVTGIKTVKLTANGGPDTAQHIPQYSTLGLSISQAWGPGRDQYTIALLSSSGSNLLMDYKIGGTCSNYRSFPGLEGRYAFSRQSGNERILYIATGTQLRRYDTAANAYADTGSFPYTWNAANWLQLNHAETWATALSPNANEVTALRLSDGTVIVKSGLTSLDEIYSGYNNIALVNRGATASQVWNLDTNTLTSVTLPNANFGVTHAPSMNGYWMVFDSNTGGGVFPWARLAEDGTCSAPFNQASGYWGQLHSCGHWQQSAGVSQWQLISDDKDVATAPGVSGSLYGLMFMRCDTGECRFLGHSYSYTDALYTNWAGWGSQAIAGYYAQPHATQSTDGRLVVFGSNMLNSTRLDAFLMEVPVQ